MKETTRQIWIVLLIMSSSSVTNAQDHKYDVIYDIPMGLRPRYVDLAHNEALVSLHIGHYSKERLDARQQEVQLLQTKQDWQARNQHLRRMIHQQLSPWPERGPLNPKVLGTIKQDGYRIEKIQFESIPGFPVSSVLYLPDNITSPRPGILYIPGHAKNGFRHPGSQHIAINLAKKGFVVLAYDPLDQGERLQNIDPQTGNPFRAGKHQYDVHKYPANPCFLLGVSIARYFIWDGMRGIDYLCSRAGVDPQRIGVCGNSGGGNMTVFVAALDDRVTAAVSSCWTHGYHRRLQKAGGNQDAEQDILYALEHGIDHADWLILRAPKPMLLLTKLNDFFPIQGTRETIEEVQEVYDLFGASDNFDFSEDFGGHGYTQKNREALNAFFQKHLNQPGDPREQESSPLSDEELTVTSTGQVVTANPGCETIFSLNRKEGRALLERIRQSRKRGEEHLIHVKERAAWLSGYHAPLIDQDDVILRGAFPHDGFRIEKYLVTGAKFNTFSFLLWLPDGPGPYPAVIYLDDQGKKIDEQTHSQLDTLARQGYLVVALEVMGTGETTQASGRWKPQAYHFYYQGAFCRRSHVALWADNVVRMVYHLQDRWPVQPGRITGIAKGPLGVGLLHAAAFEPDLNSIVLLDSPVSYEAIVMNGFYTWEPYCFVPGALTAYDLQDLMAALAPKTLILVNPLDQHMQSVNRQWIDRHLSFARMSCQSKRAAQRLQVLPAESKFVDVIKQCIQ